MYNFFFEYYTLLKLSVQCNNIMYIHKHINFIAVGKNAGFAWFYASGSW